LRFFLFKKYKADMPHEQNFLVDCFVIKKRVRSEKETLMIYFAHIGGAGNFFADGLKPPQLTLGTGNKPCFKCFRKFSGWDQPAFAPPLLIHHLPLRFYVNTPLMMRNSAIYMCGTLFAPKISCAVCKGLIFFI
jgi:hypothetical protein